jgi:hypothetical protein
MTCLAIDSVIAWQRTILFIRPMNSGGKYFSSVDLHSLSSFDISFFWEVKPIDEVRLLAISASHILDVNTNIVLERLVIFENGLFFPPLEFISISPFCIAPRNAVSISG